MVAWGEAVPAIGIGFLRIPRRICGTSHLTNLWAATGSSKRIQDFRRSSRTLQSGAGMEMEEEERRGGNPAPTSRPSFLPSFPLEISRPWESSHAIP